MIENLVNDLLMCKEELEWLEFKENWFDKDGLGEYISAISNSTAYYGRKEGYFIWGIKDGNHELVGTSFDQNMAVNGNEPLKHYLERQLTPDVRFEFYEELIEGKRIVVMVVPAAKNVPTAFKGVRYIRIGSSKEKISKFPERESYLFSVLRSGLPTIINTPSNYQDLTFHKLFGYYGSRGIVLKEDTFKHNLELLTESGKYNIQAQLLSDNSHLPLRVSIFDGDTKASNLFSVREFGFDCLLYSLDSLLRYGDVLNIIQADERNRDVERKEVPLFDNKAFNEAIINAVLHNNWIENNEPMISVFSNRIEILSRGTLAPSQTLEGFFLGESRPVNQKLSEIFLQLHISEKSGRGVPTIVSQYGKEAFEFRENSIVVTIPFNWISGSRWNVGNKVGNKEASKIGYKKAMTDNRIKILSEMRNYPHITKAQLSKLIGINPSAIDKNIAYLKNEGYLRRIGSNKSGYWEVIDEETS